MLSCPAQGQAYVSQTKLFSVLGMTMYMSCRKCCYGISVYLQGVSWECAGYLSVSGAAWVTGFCDAVMNRNFHKDGGSFMLYIFRAIELHMQHLT
jgi:hypothetical protein